MYFDFLVRRGAAAFALATALLAAGCAPMYPAPPYDVMTGRQPAAATAPAGADRLGVGAFTVRDTKAIDTQCRAAGPISFEPSLDGYVRDAVRTELQARGRFDAAARSLLGGRIEAVGLSTGLPASSWSLSVAFNRDGQAEVSRSVTVNFPTSFTGLQACLNAARAFPLALQRLMDEAFADPVLGLTPR